MTLPIQLISTDFDGTLHAEFEDPPVPRDLQMLLGDLQRQGAPWIINTGRDLPSVMEGMARARLSIKPDYLVTVEREIYVHVDAQYVALEAWNQRCHEAHAALFRRIKSDLPRLVKWISQHYAATLYEDAYSPFCMIAENPAAASAIEAYLLEYCREVPELALVRNDVYARFSHKAFNKGTALGEIARRHGVLPDRTFAAGDHLNDLPMLSAEFARCVAAPDNAVPEVKETVRRLEGYVSHQPWGHGVARALEHYLNHAPPR
jgi:hypothetical protein